MRLPAPAVAQEGEVPALRRAGSKRCRNTRLLETGYRFRYPSFREGYGAMLRSE